MAKIVRGQSDTEVLAVCAALNAYERNYPGAEASLYRQNPGSIHVRIVDDRFAGMPRSQRHSEVWGYLNQRFAEDVMCQVATLILVSTREIGSSISSMVFDDPVSESR
jgi:hypothetical protein